MAKIAECMLEDLDREETTEEGISDYYIERIRKEERDMRLYEIRLELDRGNALRHKSWAPGCYILKHFDSLKGHFILTKFNEHYTTPFSLGSFDEYTDYDYEIYNGNVKTDKDKLKRVMNALSEGARLTRPNWTNSYIYREAKKSPLGDERVSYIGEIRIHWVQDNGNVYDEPYKFGKFDDLLFERVSEDEVRRIWGFYKGSH